MKIQRARIASGSLRLLAALGLLAGAWRAWAAAPPTPPADPDRFIVVGDRLVWCEQRAYPKVVVVQPYPPCDVSWRCAAVRGTREPRRLEFPHQTSQYSVQYRVAFGSFWLVSRNGQFGSEYDAFEYIRRHTLKDLIQKAEENGRGGWRVADTSLLEEETAGDAARWRSRLTEEKRFQAYTDFTVTGPLSVRQFVLLAQKPEDDDDAPWKWSLEVYAATFASSEEPEEKIQGEWKHDETLPVAFREPFTLLTRGGDYYFVTRSGRVFHSAKPAKGGKREVKCVWSEPKRKVVCTLTDAKTNRSFLFCRAPAGERPAYFELDPKPRPVPYGERAVEFPAYEPTVATGRTFARALIADGKVKLSSKDEGKK